MELFSQDSPKPQRELATGSPALLKTTQRKAEPGGSIHILECLRRYEVNPLLKTSVVIPMVSVSLARCSCVEHSQHHRAQIWPQSLTDLISAFRSGHGETRVWNPYPHCQGAHPLISSSITRALGTTGSHREGQAEKHLLQSWCSWK